MISLNNLKQAPLLLAVVLSPIAYPCSASEVKSLDRLLQEGKIELELIGSGGHSEECITLRATNLSDVFLISRLEPGRTLLPEDESEQSIIVTQELIFAVQANQTVEKQVFGFCFQSLDAGPSSGSLFALGALAEGSLFAVAEYLNQNQDLPGSVQQEAIWVVSDCHPLSSIHASTEASVALADFVADQLGLEKPWYTTDHAKTVDQLFTEQIERLYGDIPFDVEDYLALTITIRNDQGRIVKRLIRSTNYGPGHYTQPIDLQVKYWPQGEYAIRFEEDSGALLEEKTFEL